MFFPLTLVSSGSGPPLIPSSIVPETWAECEEAKTHQIFKRVVFLSLFSMHLKTNAFVGRLFPAAGCKQSVHPRMGYDMSDSLFMQQQEAAGRDKESKRALEEKAALEAFRAAALQVCPACPARTRGVSYRPGGFRTVFFFVVVCTALLFETRKTFAVISSDFRR